MLHAMPMEISWGTKRGYEEIFTIGRQGKIFNLMVHPSVGQSMFATTIEKSEA